MWKERGGGGGGGGSLLSGYIHNLGVLENIS